MVKKKYEVELALPAIKGRINRRLILKGQMMKRARGARAKASLGEFYIMDIHTNHLIRKDVDVEAYAREIGAIKPFEGVEPIV